MNTYGRAYLFPEPEVEYLAEADDRAHQRTALAVLRQAVVDAGRVKSKVGETHQKRLDARSRAAVTYLVVGLWEPADDESFHVLSYLPDLVKQKDAIATLADDLYNRRRPPLTWEQSADALVVILGRGAESNAPKGETT